MSSSVLAGPPGSCCVKHVKHTGEPAGRTIEIAGVPTYISEPSDVANGEKPKRIILFYSDIFTPFFLNSQLLQDYFAEKGYLVLGIDYLFGDSVANHLGKEGFQLLPWALGKKKRADEVAPEWLKEVKRIYGQDAKYFSTGYCFGAPYIMDLAATDEVIASAFAHPSFLEESHFQKITSMYSASTESRRSLTTFSRTSLAVVCRSINKCYPEEDFTFPKDARRKAEDILVEKKATYQIQVFGGVAHGFATKANLEVEQQRWAKEAAADAVIRWFDRF